MCEPATIIMGIGAGIAAIGTAVSAGNQAEAGARADRAAKANAKLEDMASAEASRDGARTAGLVRMQGSKIEASQKVAFAKNNVAPGSESAAAVMADSNLMADIDYQTVLNNAAREAWGHEKQAHNLRKYGSDARDAGGAGAAGTVLGGVGDLAMRFGMPGSSGGGNRSGYRPPTGNRLSNTTPAYGR